MRTEKEILQDFEQLGYKEKKSNVDSYVLGRKIDNNATNYIVVSREFKFIDCYLILYSLKFPYSIELEEHKLLHELFECWGWL